MGGPWRDRTFDAAAWQPPVPRREVGSEQADRTGEAWPVGTFVLAYVAAVVTTLLVMLGLLYGGW